MRGSIQKRQGPQGTAYRARVEYAADPVTGKRHQRSETFRTKKEAETALSKWLAEIERGTAVDTTKMTVAEFLRHWLDTTAAHRVRPTTLEDYRATIEHHIIPSLGSVPIQRLTPVAVQSFYATKLSAGCGARTVQLCHLRLSQALAQGVKVGVLARNVCDAIDPPKATPKKGQTWTPDEAKRFLAVASGDKPGIGEGEPKADGYHPLWLLALATGARQGELLGLRWQDLDLTKGAMSIRQSVAVCERKVIIQAPKSRAAVRTIGLPPEAVATLREHRVKLAAVRLAALEWTDLDLVFATPTGGPIHPSNVVRNFTKLVQRADVPRIRFHDLRHTHATWLISNGEPVTNVSERLGHAKTSITLDTYAHVVGSTRDRAALVVSSLLFNDDGDAATA